MKENKIQLLYTELNGAWVKIHLHGSCNMPSNATGCPDCSKYWHHTVSQHAESKFAIRIAL